MKPKANSQLKGGVQEEWRLLIMESKSKFVVNYHKLHFIHIVSRLDSKSPSKLHEKKHHPYFTKCANTWSYGELVLEYFKRQSIGRWRYGKHMTNKII